MATAFWVALTLAAAPPGPGLPPPPRRARAHPRGIVAPLVRRAALGLLSRGGGGRHCESRSGASDRLGTGRRRMGDPWRTAHPRHAAPGVVGARAAGRFGRAVRPDEKTVGGSPHT